MATAKTKRKGPRKPDSVQTSSFDVTVRALVEGKDVVLVSATGKRDEVRIRPTDLVGSSKVGRFGFLEYRPSSFALCQTRLFVDDEDTGVERRHLPAALVEAASFWSSSRPYLESRAHAAEAACRVLGFSNQ